MLTQCQSCGALGLHTILHRDKLCGEVSKCTDTLRPVLQRHMQFPVEFSALLLSHAVLICGLLHAHHYLPCSYTLWNKALKGAGHFYAVMWCHWLNLPKPLKQISGQHCCESMPCFAGFNSLCPIESTACYCLNNSSICLCVHGISCIWYNMLFTVFFFQVCQLV